MTPSEQLQALLRLQGERKRPHRPSNPDKGFGGFSPVQTTPSDEALAEIARKLNNPPSTPTRPEDVRVLQVLQAEAIKARPKRWKQADRYLYHRTRGRCGSLGQDTQRSEQQRVVNRQDLKQWRVR